MMLFCTTNFQFCGVLEETPQQKPQMRSASCYQNAMFSEKFHLTELSTVKIA